MDILFDQYSRYEIVARCLSRLDEQSADASPLSILDVGSGFECLLGRFLPQAQITYLDPLLATREDEEHIAGNLSDIRLQHRQFDYVVAIDTLEHIPAANRDEFLTQMRALATKGIVIAAPFEDFGAACETDDYVNERYKSIFKKDYPWLAEHFEFGLPNLAASCAHLKDEGLKIQHGGNGHVPWLKQLLSYVVCGWDVAALKQAMLEVSRVFNEHLIPFDCAAPCYRAVIVATTTEMGNVFDEARVPDAEAEQTWKELQTSLIQPLIAVMHQAEQERFDRESRLLSDITVRDAEILRLQVGLEEQSTWAMSSADGIRAANAEVIRLQGLLAEQATWVQQLCGDLDRSSSEITRLQAALVEQSSWATHSNEELQQRDREIFRLSEVVQQFSLQHQPSTDHIGAKGAETGAETGAEIGAVNQYAGNNGRS